MVISSPCQELNTEIVVCSMEMDGGEEEFLLNSDFILILICLRVVSPCFSSHNVASGDNAKG